MRRRKCHRHLKSKVVKVMVEMIKVKQAVIKIYTCCGNMQA
jgi:hypothetical protein